MTIESRADVEALRRVGRVVSVVLAEVLAAIEPGMTTAELDTVGGAALDRHGARSAPMLAYGFPAATCISVNEEAAHGVPGARVIRAGDVVNVDVSAELDGYFADTGGTRIVPPSHAGEDAALLGHSARPRRRHGRRPRRRAAGGIGPAIERTARAHRLQVIENLGSHGVGRALHEAPDHIPGYRRAGASARPARGHGDHHRALPLDPQPYRRRGRGRLDVGDARPETCRRSTSTR